MRTLIILASGVMGAVSCFLLWCLFGGVTVKGDGLGEFLAVAVIFACGFGAIASRCLPRIHRRRIEPAPFYCKGLVGGCGACDGTCDRKASPKAWWHSPVMKVAIFLVWPGFSAMVLVLMALLLCIVWCVIPFLSADRLAAATKGQTGPGPGRKPAEPEACGHGGDQPTSEWKASPSFGT